MDAVTRLVFRDDEIVMQLHVPDAAGKVNVHNYCLHLWRPQSQEEIERERADWWRSGEAWPYGDLRTSGTIPLPPRDFV